MTKIKSRTKTLPTIKSTVRRAFLRSALIPLICIELSFLVVYWVTISISNQESVSVAKQTAYQDLQLHTEKIAKRVTAQLQSVSMLTRTFAGQAEYIFNDTTTPLPPLDENLTTTEDGMLYTTYDVGGSAVYYSGLVPVGEKEINKVRLTSRLDPLMRSIYLANPLISQIYVNTHDSYNRIYPFINVLKIYEPQLDIPSYSFYYLADEKHNPLKDVVWTQAYLDPAGSGWMISSIAPVYSKQQPDKLEAVVGLDITLSTIIRQVLTSNVGKRGNAMLVNEQGEIIAMPQALEALLGIQELTSHSYDETVKQDSFKPEEFKLSQRSETKLLVAGMAERSTGALEVDLQQQHLVSWSNIEETGWKLLFWVPINQIEQQYSSIKSHMINIGVLMVLGLLTFYAVFYWFISYQAKRVEVKSKQQLSIISNLIESIGRGNYDQKLPKVKVYELKVLARLIIRMGNRLGEAYNAVAQAEYHAGHDKLTTLPNRYLMEEHLAHSIEMAKRDNLKLAVLFVDLNRFKSINDTLGHAVGDIVLKTVATRIMAKLRHADVVSRFGGDEFVVILNNIKREQDVQILVDTIKHTISIPVDYNDGCVQVTASIGYSIYPDHGDDRQTLIIHADSEMYKEKPSNELGRND
ncbi:sensor domain-containing diguanylate cyclase [Vibrio sp. SCSIO 43136]|uniref:sensor domain-containing diguanylate cyclase n=1 Tax=Vibrio sp. SCSIO 43136 TaxID=2819101 RepID=UPI002074F240|nr:sensor domain-containing diguanylate cyclase [Vibrio sp. SCSIO 43136]USD64690.1 diguanylate cyclase [Vibrio sp. SCSIO 43136]